MDWKPIARAEFEVILQEEFAKLPAEELKLYETYATALLEQPCYRSEQYGIERVFVVARAGRRLLLFDDVDDEFAIGIPDSDGVLRNWSLYGTLAVAVRNLPTEALSP